MKKVFILLLTISCVFLVACNKDDQEKLEEEFMTHFVGDWQKPGLYEKDGSAHTMPTKLDSSKGSVIEVDFYGAKANDPNFDNYRAFKAAIEAASDNDTILVGEGDYYFTGYSGMDSYKTHIKLKSNVTFKGAGSDKTRLISCFDETLNQNSGTTTILCFKTQNVVISDLTVTSNTSDSQLPDENSSSLISKVYTAPKYQITVDSGLIMSQADQTNNVVIENCLIEKFQRMGVRICRAIDNTVTNCTFQKAVCLAGCGFGYGVTVQGPGHDLDMTDKTIDTKFNVVEGNTFKGPWIRHSVIVQYYAHNNLITNNTTQDVLLDSIDMHGEDEYSNEISYNKINNTRKGAGVGIGNSGASHDKSGNNNYIHHNVIDGGLRGIDILYGSEFTFVYKNEIKNLQDPKSIGINCSYSNNTYIVDNEFTNISNYAVKVGYYYVATDPNAGIPDNYQIIKNKFNYVDNGIYVDTHTKNFVYDNTFTGLEGEEIIDKVDEFLIPGAIDVTNPVTGFEVIPLQNQYVTREDLNSPGAQKNMKLKTSIDEPQYNRAIYALFDTSEVTTYKKVYLSITAKAQIGKPTINVWSNTTYTDWVDVVGYDNSLSWNNAPLHNETMATANTNNPDHPLKKLVDFTFPIESYNFNTYYIDVTEAYKQIDNNLFTLLLTNDAVEESYMEVYSKMQTASNQHFRLIFVNE